MEIPMKNLGEIYTKEALARLHCNPQKRELDVRGIPVQPNALITTGVVLVGFGLLLLLLQGGR
ncbi:MAG: hypothetical protein DPW14_10570 [Planctomycetes bacterium]|nr:hypothetical protein [Planctomycetota bacterium]